MRTFQANKLHHLQRESCSNVRAPAAAQERNLDIAAD
jgi:hypothetical protein